MKIIGTRVIKPTGSKFLILLPIVNDVFNAEKVTQRAPTKFQKDLLP